MSSHKFALMLVSIACLAPAAAAVPQGGDHRWGGLVFDSFALDRENGIEAWTVEDGGRIRHRDPASALWTFQSVPDEVKDTLRRVHFLDGGAQAGLTGWACGQDGWVIKTTDGGTTWVTLARIASPSGGWEELYDLDFLDAAHGWMVGVESFWATDDGGTSWFPVTIVDPQNGTILSLGGFRQLWALDVMEWPDGSRLGLAVMKPGFVLRSYSSSASDPNVDLLSWEKVWDIQDLCPPGGQTACEQGGGPLTGCECEICSFNEHGPWFELWDVEISPSTSAPLALFSGGLAAQCGVIFSSTPHSTSQLGIAWTKEWHECQCQGPGCHPNCAGDPLYNDDPGDPNDLNRHKDFKTLYGLGLVLTSHSAVAAGYNGQLVVRDPATGVWQDRSRFAGGVNPPAGAIIYPLIGAETGTASFDPDFVLVTGDGGHMLESSDGGQTWSNAQAPIPGNQVVGEPHRVEDVHFIDDQTGWRVGQFFRIARTDDGGYTWTEQRPFASASLGHCRAVTFASDGQRGVAVGDPYSPSGGTTVPKIRWTASGGGPPDDWSDAVTILGDPNFINGKGLREVEWAGGSTFWAVGGGGLILNSANDGKTWRLFLPPSDPSLAGFELEGVAFRDPSAGIFVGQRPPAGGGTPKGAVYQYSSSGGSLWSALTLAAGVDIDRLLDADVQGNVAWVVGEKIVNQEPQGIVLTSTYSGGSFGPFVEVLNPSGFPRTISGSALNAPVLNEVEIAPESGNVWVGGMCGRMWVRNAVSGAWTQIKSQTDAHVVGMSFVSLGQGNEAGYVAGYRSNQTQQCIVRVQ